MGVAMEPYRTRGHRTVSALTILVLVTAGPTGATAVAEAAPGAAPGAPAAPGGPVRTVTLVTGDQVTIVNGGAVAMRRGPGRERTGFVTQHVDGHLHVIPSDTMSLLRSGRLDSRLFDVTALLEAGYDDRRGDLPLILEHEGAARGAVPAGASVVRDLPGIDAVAVRQSRRDATTFWRAVTARADAWRVRCQPVVAPGGIHEEWIEVEVALAWPICIAEVVVVGVKLALIHH